MYEQHSAAEQDDSHGNSGSLSLHTLNQKKHGIGPRLHAFLLLENIENKEPYSVYKGHRQPASFCESCFSGIITRM